MSDERQKLLDAHEAHCGGRDIRQWKDPRKAIAPPFENDDLAYSISGAWHATKILRCLNLPLAKLSKMRLIDVGCGTGKVTRILAMFARSADGWDPQPECIEAARAETARCMIASSGWPPAFHEDLPAETYDLIVCTDVVPGLGLAAASKICDTFSRLAAPGARLVANVRNFREPTISAMLKPCGFQQARPFPPGETAILANLCLYLWVHE